VVKRVKHFEIQRSGRKGYIVHNKRLPWKGHHTHLNDYGLCLRIINNVLEGKRPSMGKIRLLTSHKRLAEDNEYKALIDELIESRKDKKKQKYVDNHVRIR